MKDLIEWLKSLLVWLIRKIISTVTLSAIIITGALIYRFFDEKIFLIRPFPYSVLGVLIAFVLLCIILTLIYLSLYYNEDDNK